MERRSQRFREAGFSTWKELLTACCDTASPAANHRHFWVVRKKLFPSQRRYEVQRSYLLRVDRNVAGKASQHINALMRYLKKL